MAWSSESAGSNLCNERSTFARCVRSSERRAFSALAIASCSFMSRCIQFELKGVVPTNYPATTEPHGLRRPKNTNAMIARSRSKRQRHDPPTAKGDNPCGNAAIRRGDSGSSAAVDISTPLRRIRPPCCARAASGHAAAAQPSSVMNDQSAVTLAGRQT